MFISIVERLYDLLKSKWRGGAVGSSFGSYPKGRRFESFPRSHLYVDRIEMNNRYNAFEGERIKDLTPGQKDAIEAARRAVEIEPDNQEYASRLQEFYAAENDSL